MNADKNLAHNISAGTSLYDMEYDYNYSSKTEIIETI